MRTKTGRFLSALLLWGLILSLCGGAALAEDAESPALPEGCWEVRLYVDGLLSGRALGNYEGVWLSPEDFCALLGQESATWWDADAGELTVSANGFLLHALLGQETFSVNSRYFYEPGGFLIYDGRSWFPQADIERMFGVSLRVSSDGDRVDVKSEELSFLPGGAAWYYDNFGSAEIFWLARIIHSEAGNQPLAGKIGVGNVVLNRVASDRYPDEVLGVVFDDQYAVQFTPAASGSVYKEPEEADVIAACLCLEGYNTVGDSMYFVNAALADDGWFTDTKDFVIRIGDHDFYRLRED